MKSLVYADKQQLLDKITGVCNDIHAGLLLRSITPITQKSRNVYGKMVVILNNLQSS